MGQPRTRKSVRLERWIFSARHVDAFPGRGLCAPRNSWSALGERDKLGRRCPDFVIELLSPSDSLRKAQEKMKNWIANGAAVGWLIDPAQAAGDGVLGRPASGACQRGLGRREAGRWRVSLLIWFACGGCTRLKHSYRGNGFRVYCPAGLRRLLGGIQNLHHDHVGVEGGQVALRLELAVDYRFEVMHRAVVGWRDRRGLGGGFFGLAGQAGAEMAGADGDDRSR